MTGVPVLRRRQLAGPRSWASAPMAVSSTPWTPTPGPGHRSATNSRPAGPYVGYELHLGVQARDVRWTNHIDRTTLGPEVPGVITTCNLVPAGTHRGRASRPVTTRDQKTRPTPHQRGVGSRLLALPSGDHWCTPSPKAALLRPSSRSRTSGGGGPSRERHSSSTDSSSPSHLPQDLHDLPAPASRGFRGREADLRGQVQSAGPLAPGPTRRP